MVINRNNYAICNIICCTICPTLGILLVKHVIPPFVRLRKMLVMKLVDYSVYSIGPLKTLKK